LKVGHHGSAYGTADAFLAEVRPRYAIISVGRHNLFGHPAPSTIERLERFGAQIYRTDQNGAIVVTTDGRSVQVVPMMVSRSSLLPRAAHGDGLLPNVPMPYLPNLQFRSIQKRHSTSTCCSGYS